MCARKATRARTKTAPLGWTMKATKRKPRENESREFSPRRASTTTFVVSANQSKRATQRQAKYGDDDEKPIKTPRPTKLCAWSQRPLLEATTTTTSTWTSLANKKPKAAHANNSFPNRRRSISTTTSRLRLHRPKAKPTPTPMPTPTLAI